MDLFGWLSGHALLLLLVVGTIFSFLWLAFFQKKLPVAWWAAALLSIGHTAIGVVSVKVFAVLETLDFSNAGNMSLFGGVFFMPLLYLAGAKLFRQDAAAVCDVFTPCMIGTLLCARVNCIISGCCRGLPLPGSSGLRWPTREAEILFYFVLLFVLIRRIGRRQTFGEVYPIYMIAYGIFRFIAEWFREASSPLGVIHLGHIWALVCLGLGLSIYSALKNKKHSPKTVRR